MVLHEIYAIVYNRIEHENLSVMRLRMCRLNIAFAIYGSNNQMQIFQQLTVKESYFILYEVLVHVVLLTKYISMD